MGSVSGKVALITGGANGIGAEVARRLHAKGAKLVLTDLDEVLLKEVATRLGEDKVLTVVADVRDFAAMQSAAEKGIERFGGHRHRDGQRRYRLLRFGVGNRP